MLWNYNLSSCTLEPIIFHVFPPKSPDFPHNFLVFPLIFLDKIENLSGKTMFSSIKTEKHKFIRVHSPYFPRFFPFSFLFIPQPGERRFFWPWAIPFCLSLHRHLKTRWLPAEWVANHKVGNDGTRKDDRETSSNVIVPERLI